MAELNLQINSNLKAVQGDLDRFASGFKSLESGFAAIGRSSQAFAGPANALKNSNIPTAIKDITRNISILNGRFKDGTLNVGQYQEQLRASQRVLNQLTSSQTNLNKSLAKNGAQKLGQNLVRLRSEIVSTREEQQKLTQELKNGTLNSQGSARLRELTTNLNAYKKVAREAGVETELFGRRLSLVDRFLARLGLSAVFFRAAQAIRGATNEFVAFDKTLIGVQKTTGFNLSQIDKFRDSVLGMSREIGLSIDEIGSIGQIAGQLGIGEQGVGAVSEFTEVVAKSRIALNDFQGSTEQLAETIARQINAFGLGADQAENYVSVVNELSNTTAASTTQLFAFGKNFAGTARAFDISADKALSLGAALIEVGQAGDDAGTRLSGAIDFAFKNIDTIAESTSLTGDTLKKAFDSDAIGGLKLVIEELQNYSSNVELATISNEIFGRVGNRAIKLLLSDWQRYEDNLQTANKQLREATSLQAEFDVASNSISAQLQGLVNSFQELFNVIGQRLTPALLDSVNVVKFFVNQFTNFISTNNIVIASIRQFAFLIGSSVLGAALIRLAGSLSKTAGSALGLNLSLTKLKAGFVTLGTAMKTSIATNKAMGVSFARTRAASTLLSTGIKALTVAVRAFIFSLGGFVLGVQAALFIYNKFTNLLPGSAARIREIQESFDEVSTAIDGNIEKLNDLNEVYENNVGNQLDIARDRVRTERALSNDLRVIDERLLAAREDLANAEASNDEARAVDARARIQSLQTKQGEVAGKIVQINQNVSNILKSISEDTTNQKIRDAEVALKANIDASRQEIENARAVQAEDETRLKNIKLQRAEARKFVDSASVFNPKALATRFSLFLTEGGESGLEEEIEERSKVLAASNAELIRDENALKTLQTTRQKTAIDLIRFQEELNILTKEGVEQALAAEGLNNNEIKAYYETTQDDLENFLDIQDNLQEGALRDRREAEKTSARLEREQAQKDNELKTKQGIEAARSRVKAEAEAARDEFKNGDISRSELQAKLAQFDADEKDLDERAEELGISIGESTAKGIKSGGKKAKEEIEDFTEDLSEIIEDSIDSIKDLSDEIADSLADTLDIDTQLEDTIKDVQQEISEFNKDSISQLVEFIAESESEIDELRKNIIDENDSTAIKTANEKIKELQDEVSKAKAFLNESNPEGDTASSQGSQLQGQAQIRALSKLRELERSLVTDGRREFIQGDNGETIITKTQERLDIEAKILDLKTRLGLIDKEGVDTLNNETLIAEAKRLKSLTEAERLIENIKSGQASLNEELSIVTETDLDKLETLANSDLSEVRDPARERLEQLQKLDEEEARRKTIEDEISEKKLEAQTLVNQIAVDGINGAYRSALIAANQAAANALIQRLKSAGVEIGSGTQNALLPGQIAQSHDGGPAKPINNSHKRASKALGANSREVIWKLEKDEHIYTKNQNKKLLSMAAQGIQMSNMAKSINNATNKKINNTNSNEYNKRVEVGGVQIVTNRPVLPQEVQDIVRPFF